MDLRGWVSPEAAPVFVAVALDESLSRSERVRAIFFLELMQDTVAVRLLAPLLTHADPSIALAAREVLRHMANGWLTQTSSSQPDTGWERNILCADDVDDHSESESDDHHGDDHD